MPTNKEPLWQRRLHEKESLHPHVPQDMKTQSPTDSLIELLKQWHQIVGEMLIDNEIDLSKYPGIKALHNRTFQVIREKS